MYLGSAILPCAFGLLRRLGYNIQIRDNTNNSGGGHGPGSYGGCSSKEHPGGGCGVGQSIDIMKSSRELQVNDLQASRTSRGSLTSRENSFTSRNAEDGMAGGGASLAEPGQGMAVTDPMLSTSPSGSLRRSSETCCFCWCCCCSCSCISVQKGNESTNFTRVPLATKVMNVQPEDTITSEDVRNWGESFERLLQSSKGRNIFREFLRSEYSEENVLFWIACEELKQLTNKEAIEEKARSIYEDYISILSPKEVSLDSKSREIVNRNMFHLSGPSPNTFDDAQLQIFTLMHRDSYPRFLNSNLYKKLTCC